MSAITIPKQRPGINSSMETKFVLFHLELMHLHDKNQVIFIFYKCHT